MPRGRNRLLCSSSKHPRARPPRRRWLPGGSALSPKEDASREEVAGPPPPAAPKADGLMAEEDRLVYTSHGMACWAGAALRFILSPW